MNHNNLFIMGIGENEEKPKEFCEQPKRKSTPKAGEGIAAFAEDKAGMPL